MAMSPEQQKKFSEMVRIGVTTWPPMTDDPHINYELDRYMDNQDLDPDETPVPPWEEANEDERRIYTEEAELHKT